MIRLLLLVALATHISCEKIDHQGVKVFTKRAFCGEYNIRNDPLCDQIFKDFLKNNHPNATKCDTQGELYSNQCSMLIPKVQTTVRPESVTQKREAASTPNASVPQQTGDSDLELPAPSATYSNKVMDFALNLFQKSLPSDGASNYIISPLMVQTLLSYLIDGASNNTRREMETVLQLDQVDLQNIDLALQPHKRDEPQTKNKLDAASQIYKSTNFKLTNEFRSSLKTKGVPLSNIDFTNPRFAAETINQWVTQKTRRRITEIVEENSINPDTKLLLLNALYFNGTWMTKFPKTDRGTFSESKDIQKAVKMMFLSKELRSGNTRDKNNPESGMTWIELPYDGDQMSMILLLPNERYQLDRELRRFTTEQLRGILDEIRLDEPGKVRLELPEFKAETTVSLVDPLKRMGVGSIFGDNNPFDKLSVENVKISDVKQKSFLAVNPHGTVAASVTTATVIPLSISHTLEFKADQPFALIIMDKRNQLPLFFAKISKPLKLD